MLGQKECRIVFREDTNGSQLDSHGTSFAGAGRILKGLTKKELTKL
jgi:hypothetical protein